MARQRRARAVEADVVVGTLVVVGRVELRACDGGRAAADVAEIEGAAELIGAAVKAVAEIDSPDVGVAAEKALGPLIDIAVHGRRHEPDAARPVAEVLRQPQHAVVRRRLEGDAAVGRALGEPLHRTDREAAGEAAGDLGGAEDSAGVVADTAGRENAPPRAGYADLAGCATLQHRPA